jgi:hypothetical protein
MLIRGLSGILRASMTGAETDMLSGADVAGHYRQLFDKKGSFQVRAGKLMTAFGYSDLAAAARSEVAEHLFAAGLLTQPSLESTGLTTRTQLKLLDKAKAEAKANEASVRYAINPAGVALACLGGLAMAIAAFLPLDESGEFARVQANSLIHHGGWAFLVLGAGVALSSWRQYSGGKRGWAVVVLGAIALIDAIATGKNHGYRTLYPLNSAGEPDSSQPGTLVPLGLAVYVAGTGACVAMLGGFIMRQSPSGEAAAPAPVLKVCPDCAETVQAAANVCKHCGYRFSQ